MRSRGVSPADDKTARGSNGDRQTPATDAVRLIFERLGDIRAHAALYLQAERDRVKLILRQAAIWSALGVLGMIVVGSSLAVAAAYLVIGFAHAMRGVFSEHPWAGELIAGGAVLTVAALSVAVALSRLRAAWFRSTVQRYVARKDELRRRNGHHRHE